MAIVVLETLIEKCPSWGYILLLLVAFSGCVIIAGLGMRMVGSMARRMRRS